MADEKNQSEADKGQPIIDAFGAERDADGKIVTPPMPETKDADKDGEDNKEADKKADKEADKTPAIDENHPVVKKMQESIDKIKDDYGKNLSGQRRKIESLEAELAKYKDGKAPKADEKPFKEIKRTKDLTKDQLEEMTDTEKRQMDSIADLQEMMNKQHEEANKVKETDGAKDKDDKDEEDEGDDFDQEAFEKKVQTAVLAMTNNDSVMGNKIIEKFNQFAGNDKLTDSQIKDRLNDAAKLVSDYKPPKEQTSRPGRAAKSTDNDDPNNVDHIINEVTASKHPGGYSL